MTDAQAQAPRIQRREVWVDLPAEYPGFRARVWVNPPSKLWASLGSGDKVKQIEAVTKIVIEHNGWLDYDGSEYPSPDTEAFWDAIPDELCAVLLTVIQKKMGDLPNSLIPRGRR